MQQIHLIATGGTIDSVWSGIHDTAVVNEHSSLPEYFKELGRNLKFPTEFTFTEVCMKDSRELTDEDRKKLLEEVEKNKADKILITHGTYTMPDTAKFLKKKLKREDQTIVLTGSMVPIKGFDFSDGPFNLGFAIAMLEKLDKGIWVCMNAKAFSPEEVAKNISEGKFYSVFEDPQ